MRHFRILNGDVLAGLARLAPESVQTCVTSPPYYGLRDYGTAKWEGGSAQCDHKKVSPGTASIGKSTLGPNRDGVSGQATNGHQQEGFRDICGKCGARRVDGQIGLERTPDEYVARLVEVFREVRRVLKDDGTCWLNLGDSYNGGNKGNSGALRPGMKQFTNAGSHNTRRRDTGHLSPTRSGGCAGLKVKDLIGIPWRVAFALQADGWYLRQDIIWHKPNPMPESVRDRCTKAHEYVFLLAKGQWKTSVIQFADLPREQVHFGKNLRPNYAHMGPNKFCVLLASEIFDRAQREKEFRLPPFYAEEWKQGTNGNDSDFVRRLPSVHGATAWAARFLNADATAEEFLKHLNRVRLALSNSDEFLIRRITPKGLASPAFDTDGKASITIHYAGEVCKIEFGHERIVHSRVDSAKCRYYYDADAVKEPAGPPKKSGRPYLEQTEGIVLGRKLNPNCGLSNRTQKETRNRRSVWTITPKPFRGAHFAVMPEALVEPCILAGSKPGDLVLDPFAGSGTVGVVANRYGRHFVGCELNPEYAGLARQRAAAA